MTDFQKYEKLNIDGTWINLEKGDTRGGYFCTPVGARVIGWENGIHYCFIRGFGEMVFAVNPDSCVEENVYPLAASFRDFLRLLLACGTRSSGGQRSSSGPSWRRTRRRRSGRRCWRRSGRPFTWSPWRSPTDMSGRSRPALTGTGSAIRTSSTR